MDREIEHDCDGKDVVWLTVGPEALQIAIYDSFIQVGDSDFYEEWDGTPSELMEKASERVVSVTKGGT